MEQVGEDLVVNGIVGNGVVHGSGCDIPLKVDGHDVFGSPMLGPESSSHDYTGTIRREDDDLAEAPYTRFRSINVTRDAVQELTVRNYRSPSQPLVRIGGFRQRKLQHEYLSPTGRYRCKVLHDDYLPKDHDKILSRAGHQLRKTRSDFWSLKPFLSEQIDDMREISACSRASNSKTVASGDTALKTSSAFNFFHLNAKKALKGKGVVHRDREVLTDLDSVVKIDDNMGYALKVASHALMRSNAKSDQLSLHRTNKYGPEALQSGISLREWLKTRRHRGDKIESLQIFRQSAELVDAEHSQGVPFRDLRPSYFTLLPSNKIVFTESSAKKESKVAISCSVVKKRPIGHDGGAYCSLVAKQQKLSEVKSLRSLSDTIASRTRSRRQKLVTLMFQNLRRKEAHPKFKNQWGLRIQLQGPKEMECNSSQPKPSSRNQACSLGPSPPALHQPMQQPTLPIFPTQPNVTSMLPPSSAHVAAQAVPRTSPHDPLANHQRLHVRPTRSLTLNSNINGCLDFQL